MDLTFHTDDGCYNVRVAALLLRDDHLLVMRDAPDSHDYLPGGRVRLHEPMEHALLRELREELQIDARILRPLWLNQCFFHLKPSGERVHEQCLYFLAECSDDALTHGPDAFARADSDGYVHFFRWLPFDELPAAPLYPLFLARRIRSLPDHLELILEDQDGIFGL
ncbi:MAG: NUDIX domain-containing protein [Clostridia bacterium]|nr:NUDIX domain-containing protein [Clostridia bacterium]